jgi:hypothetical protein
MRFVPVGRRQERRRLQVKQFSAMWAKARKSPAEGPAGRGHELLTFPAKFLREENWASFVYRRFRKSLGWVMNSRTEERIVCYWCPPYSRPTNITDQQFPVVENSFYLIRRPTSNPDITRQGKGWQQNYFILTATKCLDRVPAGLLGQI